MYSAETPHIYVLACLRSEGRVTNSLTLTQYDIVERSFGGNVWSQDTNVTCPAHCKYRINSNYYYFSRGNFFLTRTSGFRCPFAGSKFSVKGGEQRTELTSLRLDFLLSPLPAVSLQLQDPLQYSMVTKSLCSSSRLLHLNSITAIYQLCNRGQIFHSQRLSCLLCEMGWPI